MATQTTNIPGSGYGNVYVDSLIWGAAWTGISTPIRYWFGSGSVAVADSSIGAFTGATWTVSEESAFATALSHYSAVSNLTLTEAQSGSAADIVWWLAPLGSNTGLLGMHEVPDATWKSIYGFLIFDGKSLV